MLPHVFEKKTVIYIYKYKLKLNRLGLTYMDRTTDDGSMRGTNILSSGDGSKSLKSSSLRLT
jgi:hypothetical protein